MRLPWVALGVVVVALAGGCRLQRLQDEVDKANHRQLATQNLRSYTLMSWTDASEGRLMISDLQDGVTPSAMHSLLIFYDEQLSVQTRVDILNNDEIILSLIGLDPEESIAARQRRYAKSLALLARGYKWTGGISTTTIYPGAVSYREAESVQYHGRAVRLLWGDVDSPRTDDPLAIYDRVRAVVGLDSDTGSLVLEYLINLLPRPFAANRLLTVYDSSDENRLYRVAGWTPDQRISLYTALCGDLQALMRAVDARLPPL